MVDFVAIDFETATSSSDSACALGLCEVRDLKIVKQKEYLIKPPDNKYDKKNSQIHGITECITFDAPDFPVVWQEVKHYFNGEYVIIAHNAQFDMSVLYCCLDRYRIPYPEFKFVDSISLFRFTSAKSDSKSLQALAAVYGIPNENHHDAENDAVVCANIVIAMLRDIMRTSIRQNEKAFITDLKPTKWLGNSGSKHKKKYEKIDYKSLDISSETDSSHPLFNKHVVITGEFELFTRSELVEKLALRGARPSANVTRKTNYLLVGKQNSALVGKSGLSTKQKKVAELITQGHNVKIVYEQDILELLNPTIPPETERRLFE